MTHGDYSPFARPPTGIMGQILVVIFDLLSVVHSLHDNHCGYAA